MNVAKYESREDWLEGRKGKITGSRVGDVVTKRGTAYKLGVFEIIAERVAEDKDEENPMERGTRLEEESIAKFVEASGKEVDTSLQIWSRDDNSSMSISPDGSIWDGPAITEAVESKSLSTAKHIQAWYLKKVPTEYWEQVLQYFVVNDDLQKLHFCFYDPRVPAIEFFYLTITRDEVNDEVEELIMYEKNLLVTIDDIVNKITF